MDPVLMMAAGFVLLAAGGETLVRGAVAAARALGVSPLLIGLTLVGFGTSTPELVTALQAAAKGSPGIAVGAVVGSNIANILLILGVGALLRPIRFNAAAFKRDGAVLALVTAACVVVVLYGQLTPMVGGLFVAGLIAYVGISWLQERQGAGGKPPREALLDTDRMGGAVRPRLTPGLALAVGGMILTIVGARLLVDGAIETARASGVPETVIGLTVVAIGTSLPEMVASIAAAIRGRSDVAFGNVVGSNIYNVLGILGITALAEPIDVPPEVARFDIWVMAGAALLLLAQRNLRLGRREGLVLVLCYGLYVTAVAAGA